MPIYEYKCSACNYQFEQLQKISDEDLVICPQCQAPQLQKLISNTTFTLKGTGWYVTDYKDKNTKTNHSKPQGNADTHAEKTKNAAVEKENPTGEKTVQKVKADKAQKSSNEDKK